MTACPMCDPELIDDHKDLLPELEEWELCEDHLDGDKSADEVIAEYLEG